MDARSEAKSQEDIKWKFIQFNFGEEKKNTNHENISLRSLNHKSNQSLTTKYDVSAWAI